MNKKVLNSLAVTLDLNTKQFKPYSEPTIACIARRIVFTHVRGLAVKPQEVSAKGARKFCLLDNLAFLIATNLKHFIKTNYKSQSECGCNAKPTCMNYLFAHEQVKGAQK